MGIAMEAQTANELVDNEQDERARMTSVERATKVAERDRKCAEKEAEEEKRAAKTAKRDAKWTADVDAAIVSMIVDGFSCSKIVSELGNGLSEDDIRNRWTGYLKKLSGIIKPPVQAGQHSSITWTVDVDAAIVSMIAGDYSCSKIAMELDNGLKQYDIYDRWTRHLKD